MSDSNYPSPELINRVAEWRRKMQDGTITLDEQKEAIIVLRQNRFAAQASPAKAKAAGKAKAPKKSAEDLLSELD